MLIAVINHGRASMTADLKSRLQPHGRTVAIDSGSNLTPTQRCTFDRCLPNVYYNGLLNEACAQLVDETELLLVCSDVGISDPGRLLRRARHAFDDPRTGIYAPALSRSPHHHMRRHPGTALRRVPFAEGACFAARVSLLQTLCPIDTERNALGWGVDVYLGFLAMRRGLEVVVDDDCLVSHDAPRGYSTAQARAQRDAWFGQLSRPARLFRRLVEYGLLTQPAGLKVAQRLLTAAPTRR